MASYYYWNLQSQIIPYILLDLHIVETSLLQIVDTEVMPQQQYTVVKDPCTTDFLHS